MKNWIVFYTMAGSDINHVAYFNSYEEANNFCNSITEKGGNASKPKKTEFGVIK